MLRLTHRCWTVVLGLVWLSTAHAQTSVSRTLGDLPDIVTHPVSHPSMEPSPEDTPWRSALVPSDPHEIRPMPLTPMPQETPADEVQQAIADLNKPISAEILVAGATRALELKTESGAMQTGVDTLYIDYAKTPLIAEIARGDGSWEQHAKTWQSPNLAWHPLYFEEENVERYGFHCGHFQPSRSGAHFFGSVALLPYKIVAEHPRRCVYGLGYYRPGNCNPPVGHTRCISPVGIIAEGVVIGGLAAGL